MKPDKSKVVVHGIGFWPALGILFVALKLCGMIGWSWWVVLLPFYGPLLLAFACIVVAVACGVDLFD